MAAMVVSFSAQSVRDLASSFTLAATVFSASWKKRQKEKTNTDRPTPKANRKSSQVWSLVVHAGFYCVPSQEAAKSKAVLFDPLTPRSDQHINSPYHFNTLSSR